MNISTFSPAITLLYVWTLLWILMDVPVRGLNRNQKWFYPLLLIFLGAFNHILKAKMGPEAYSRLILLTMHIPTFVVFLRLTGCGVIKMVFMIFSAVLFSAPTVLIGNLVKWVLFRGSAEALLFSNLISYGFMLLLAQFVFRKGFNYLLKHGENRFFLLFSIVPFLYYVYMFCAMNIEFTQTFSPQALVARHMPTLLVIVFYFLLLHNYKELSEKQLLHIKQAALAQKLDAAVEQIELLNEAQKQTAIYQHDMRHHLTMIEGFLSAGKAAQAEEYIRKVQADVEAITHKRFCENESINLLCASFCGKAEKKGISMTVKAKLPSNLSIPDTELCSLVSNGLENAVNAVADLEKAKKWVEFYCEMKQNKLLIQIRNPYEGEIVMRDGLPVSAHTDHGYGCHSIRMIAERHRGLSTFEAEKGLFLLQVVLPVRGEKQ